MPAPSEGLEARRQLELLQEELQALKGRWGRALRLQRATPAEAPATAPFPIVLTFQVEPPPAAASHYDVSAVRIQIRLSRAALQLPQRAAAADGGGGGAATHGSVQVGTLPTGTDLTVLSEELPRRLRSKMQAQLVKVWLDALGSASGAAAAAGGGGGSGSGSAPSSAGPYKLSVPASHMQERFVPLICLVPELVEPYQAVDEHGATVRRYAIVNNDGDAGDTEDGGGGGGGESPGVDSSQGGGTGDGGARSLGSVALSSSSRTDAGASGSTAAAAAAAASPQAAKASQAPSAPSSGMAAAPTAGATALGGMDAAPPPAGSGAQPPAEPPTHGSVPPLAQRTAPKPDQAVGPRGAPPPASASAQPQPSEPASVPRGAGEAAARLVAGTASASAGGGGSDIPEETSASDVGRMTVGLSQPGLSAVAAAHSAPAAAPAALSATGAAAAAPPARQIQGTATARGAEPANQTTAAGATAAQPQSSPPPGLLSYTVAVKELQYIQKRYSQVFSARLHRDADSSPAAAAAAGGASAPQSLLQPGCLTTFELELLPTDPDWDLPAVRVVGQLLPVSASAYLPSLGVHMASRLPAWLRAALEAHMAEQLAAQAAEAEAARAAAAAAAEPAPPPHGAAAGLSRRAGRGGRGGGGLSGSGRVGAGGVAGQQEAEAAPEGTVLLPLGALRNLFRDLENYAGTVARAADEERRRRERDAAAAAVSDDGGSGSSGGDEEEGGDGSRYDDDGYGDGSHRREGDAAGDDYDSAGEGSDGSDDGTAADEVRFSGTAAAAAAGGAEAPAAYAVLLEGLQLDNLAAVEVLRANFEVSCGRCGARDTLVLASAAVAGGGGGSGASHQATASGCCQRCTAPWSLVMRPHFVHATSNSLCVIKPEGCRPVDLLPSLMAGQCGECSAVMSLRDVQIGLPFSRNCSSCHKELSMSVAAVSFVPRGPPRGGAGGSSGSAAGRGASRARRARTDTGGGGGGGGAGAGLRPGQPLPALGTCKHYRHSYRWLRFPCCGMRFPCDLCHEESVPDGHPVRWAQRMVCGFCSTEQHLALACRACGRQLAGTAANPSGRRTRFWEGGTGCRDPRRLDRNDPHKWRGRNKTVSAKQSRVGPKPWSGKASGGAGGGGSGG
ncbi:hypothetical protein PLESTB_000783200 [Pleodorina starrii]|uniref:CHY-type domain-containing protein n=1 Tax=Pleodorina starrii TaxID=330485 RepID=A0A9W6BL25_9CHLO|nr:hypothetical protein PLESTM_000501700 [Pleodorina starrii]GLC53750.1 hypothetical protein PLESTB_000783200 [Pleodorina starrii]GLC72930.1 hypothetical protein PLESTF_001310800 [Pleodorina starrii]